jgi:hypothetical protein
VAQIIRQRGTGPGRHHVGTPGDIISECLGDFIGIRSLRARCWSNIGRRATDDDPLTLLKLLEIEICADVFVVTKPPVNDPTVHLSLAYEHPALLKGHDQIEVT